MATVKAYILGAGENGRDAAGRSKQVPDDAWDYGKTGAQEPPYNLDALAQFLEINTWHMRCCRTKAIVTAGLGYDFVVPEGVKDPDPKNKAVLQQFFAYPNEEQTWGEILENVLTEKGGLGGAGEGTSQQEIFKYHVIEPKQTRLEYRINNFLIKRGFGIDDWEIRFREIDVTDEAKVAEIVQRLVHLGVLTINEGRHEMGYKPFDHKGADIPFIMASAGPMCLDTLVEGGVRPMNMPPGGEADTEQGRRLIESLMSIRKVLHGEMARRRAG